MKKTINDIKGSRILLVDDTAMVRKSLKRLLEVLGAEVEAVETGPIALDILSKDQNWDLIMTDFSMPGMDGAQLVSEIKRRWSTLRIVVMSGSHGADITLLKDQVDAIISKPFTAEEVRALFKD